MTDLSVPTINRYFTYSDLSEFTKKKLLSSFKKLEKTEPLFYDNDKKKIKYLVLDKLLKREFIRKEDNKTMNDRRLSNASITHICFQIINQFQSKLVFEKIKNSIINDMIWMKINQHTSHKYSDINTIKTVTKKIINNITKETRTRYIRTLDLDLIDEKTKKKIFDFQYNIIYCLFDIYKYVNIINEIEGKKHIMGNIILYNKSYRNMSSLLPRYKDILSPFVNTSKENPLFIKEKDFYVKNTVYDNNKTEMWQLCSSVIFHSKEQIDYVDSIKYEKDIHNYKKKILDSIHNLIDIMNRINKITS